MTSAMSNCTQPAPSAFLKAVRHLRSMSSELLNWRCPRWHCWTATGFTVRPDFTRSQTRTAFAPHVGAEIAVSSFGKRLTPPPYGCRISISEPARLPLLCESRDGYQNLCQLITRFKMRETTKYEGAATFDDLTEYSAGLVCLTGGDEGPLAAALMRGGEEAGRETVERLVRIFGQRNVYIEVQRHREREEEWRNQAAIRIARSLKLPVLATNGVRYATATTARSSMSLRRYAITPISTTPVVCSLSTINGICALRREMAGALPRCSWSDREHA